MKMLRKLTLVFVVTLLTKGCDCQLNVCGRAAFNTKIVGGQEAAVGSWPWQASLHSSFHFCGGSLINNEWILTAAHCFPGSPDPSTFTVYLGRHSQEQPNPHEVSRNISQIITHPAYDDFTHDNDMALLHLSSPVNFTAYIQPVCLAAEGSTFNNGSDMWVTGWGDIGSSVSLPSPQNLQEVSVPIVGNRKCNCLYGGGKITDNMMCAGLLEGGKDSCQGDSGGPIVIKQGPIWIQAGVVSFGYGCALPDYPGVYSRISQYQNWITGFTGANRTGFVSFNSSLPDNDQNETCSVPPILCGSSAVVWPMMASLRFLSSHACMGTLISPNFVMTSASCFTGAMMPFDMWTVAVGFVPWECSNNLDMSVPVKNIIVNQGSENNVAVVELAYPLELSDIINVVSVNMFDYEFGPQFQCSVVGWNAENNTAMGIEDFQATIVPCGPSIDSASYVCTEPLNVKQDDEGSPLMCRMGETWIQTGILSLAHPIAGRNQGFGPNLQVFMKTSQFATFLYENVVDTSIMDGVESFSPLSLTYILLLSLPALIQAFY